MLILRNIDTSIVVAVVEGRRVAVEVVDHGTTHAVLALTLVKALLLLLLFLFLVGGGVGDDTTVNVVWIVNASSLLAEFGESNTLDSAAQGVKGFGSGLSVL